MTIEVKVPVLPESVADALMLEWSKQVGDPVSRDEILVEVETDKVVLEVPAPADGVLVEILEPEGATVLANLTNDGWFQVPQEGHAMCPGTRAPHS